MNEIQRFIHNNNNIIVDTELLLLLLAGMDGQDTIGKLKPTKKFSWKDYETLRLILGNFNEIKTSPHILTEVSNLNKHGHYRKKLFLQLEFLIKQGFLDENFIDIKNLVKDQKFKKLGVADIGIKEISKNNNYGVITLDLGLYLELLENGIDCINFTYYMEIN